MKTTVRTDRAGREHDKISRHVAIPWPVRANIILKCRIEMWADSYTLFRRSKLHLLRTVGHSTVYATAFGVT